jgi:uncharacterized protein YbbC (DUF1343 family)
MDRPPGKRTDHERRIVARVQTGLESFIASPPEWVAGKRIGLLCNPASVDHRFRHARALVSRRFPGRLAALYAPQHGFFSEKQDNMIESEDTIDPVLDIPVFSLYGRTRIPTEEMLAPIDLLLIDLQDVGTRVYTFIYSMSYCLEAAARTGRRVIVLDRPNPVSGDRIEGNCLSPEMASFVGRYPIPMRHGLTIGELARLFNDRFDIGCKLTVIPMDGWKRSMYFEDTGLPWVAPSPNLPTPVSAMVYPGQVLWEGTNVSEGRGTTLPFELFGAPFIEPARILAVLGKSGLPGAILRETAFEPIGNKWAGQLCRGFQLHITDRNRFRPYEGGLSLLRAVRTLFGGGFRWKPPPYEYEYEREPIDLIIGDPAIRREIEHGAAMEAIIGSWQEDLKRFGQTARKYHLYG